MGSGNCSRKPATTTNKVRIATEMLPGLSLVQPRNARLMAVSMHKALPRKARRIAQEPMARIHSTLAKPSDVTKSMPTTPMANGLRHAGPDGNWTDASRMAAAGRIFLSTLRRPTAKQYTTTDVQENKNMVIHCVHSEAIGISPTFHRISRALTSTATTTMIILARK
jgi:hypothetical protein